MPTPLLEKMQRRLMLREGAAISYEPFDASGATVDPDYHEPANLDDCFPRAYTLRGVMLTYNPSEAQRTRLGLEADVDAIVEILKSELENAGFEASVKDRLYLPESDKPYYINKVIPAQQNQNSFLTVQVAVTRKTGGTRNR